MGFWGTGIYLNDFTCDVRDSYIDLLKQQIDNNNAVQTVINEYGDFSDEAEEALFWYALADTGWKTGRLLPEIKEKAIHFILHDGGIELWEDDCKKRDKWKIVLQKLKKELDSPMPKEKKFRKPEEFDRNPWNVGDLYAYKFHNKFADETGLNGKYIVFQKIGHAYDFDNLVSVVQVYDKVFDIIPTIDELCGVRILPLAYPPGIYGTPDRLEDYVPSFEMTLCCKMVYEKKRDYPKNHLYFLGTQNMSDRFFEYKKCEEYDWKKDQMDDWLIDFYLNWQNVKY